MILRIFGVFFRRDFSLRLSYRLDFILNALSILFTVTTFFYVARIMGSSAAPIIAAYGGDYFSFVLIGIAFSAYQRVGLQVLAQNVREEQVQGTLEQILATPIPSLWLLLASIQWEFLYATIEVLLYLAAGIALFGLRFHGVHWSPAILMLILTLSSFIGLGIFSAAFVVKFKRGDPIAWFIGTLSELVSGVYFPISLLPRWLQGLSRLTPMTHALEGLRMILLRGSSWTQVAPSALFLAGFTLVLIPSGLFFFRRALTFACRDGSLGHS